VVAVAVAATVATAETAIAAEGASSHYLPGVVGDFGLALPPAPGLTLANTLWLQSGDVDRAVLQGQAELDLDLKVVLALAAASYTCERDLSGGTYSVVALVPFGYAELDAAAAGAGGSRVARSGDSFNLSDVAFVPIQLNWAVGRWLFKAAQAVIAPNRRLRRRPADQPRPQLLELRHRRRGHRARSGHRHRGLAGARPTGQHREPGHELHDRHGISPPSEISTRAVSALGSVSSGRRPWPAPLSSFRANGSTTFPPTTVSTPTTAC
jgi:hypothetical protein